MNYWPIVDPFIDHPCPNREIGEGVYPLLQIVGGAHAANLSNRAANVYQSQIHVFLESQIIDGAIPSSIINPDIANS